MAVIEKIRNKYGKVAAGIIVVALIGFILMDAASGKFGELFGRDNSVVKVNGEKTDTKEYSERTREYETLYSIYGQNPNIDENTRAQISEQVLNMLVYEKVANAQCEKLGITTTKKEENDLIYGPNADQLVQNFKWQGQPVFVNRETGMFDPQVIKAFEQQVKQIDPTGKLQEQWEMVKAYVKRNNHLNKFNTLFTSSVYVPKYMLNRMAQEQDNQVSLRFVKIPYTTVPDDKVKVTDEDLKAYMKKHAAMYTAYEPTRSIEYVSFDIAPNTEDTQRTVLALTQIKNDFANAKDNKTFIIRNSDDNVEPAFVTKKTFMSQYSDSILNMPVGTVFGPYFENNAYKLTKVADKKSLPDSVKFRQILVVTKTQQGEMLADSIGKNRADSIAAVVKGGANFDSLLAKFSADETSLKTHGEYTFTMQQKEGLPKEFGDFVFEGHAGEKKVVKVTTDNYTGYHYVEIMEQKNVQAATLLATVTKSLYAGENTEATAYAKASEFAGQNATAAAFDAAVKKGNMNKLIADNIKPGTFNIPGVGPDRDVVRWAYNAKVGEVSQVFNVQNSRFVVAKLTNIQEPGLMPLTANNRPMIEAAVKNEKKAEQIANQYKSAASLDALAQTAGQPAQKADSISFGASYIPGLGYEPKVLGLAFDKNLQPNALSKAVKGQDGVYFISVTARWSKIGDPQALQMMAGQQRMMQEMQAKQGVGQQLQETITRSAKVKYNPDNM